MICTDTVGRVTNDIRLEKTKKDDDCVKFGLAVHKGYGEHKKTVFFECIAYEEIARRMAKAGVRKGSLIQISGDFDPVVYQKKDGTKGQSLNIKLYDWHYVSTGGPSAADKNEESPDLTNQEESVSPVESNRPILNETAHQTVYQQIGQQTIKIIDLDAERLPL